MVRIVMDIRMVTDGKPPVSRLLTSRFAGVENYDQVEQIAREMQTHFDQVAAENPAARAVADVLARPEEHPITAADFGRSIDISAKQMHAMGMAASASMNAAVARRLKEGR